MVAPTAGGGGSEGGTIDTSNASGDVSYWLWDANQLPAYQQCADEFKQANPNINVKITQYGWDDYWGKLTNGFVAGDAPDVFTDHLAKYPEFVSQEQLVPLDDTLTKDGFNANQYQEGPSGSVEGPGRQALRPTEGLRHRRRSSITRSWSADAGIKEADLQNIQWNPNDGGTYEKIDRPADGGQNGKRGDEPGFDKIQGQGLRPGTRRRFGSGVGQTQWSMYTGSQQLAIH